MTATSALERLHRLARADGLHVVLAEHGANGRWRIGVERPLDQVNAGERVLRSYVGIATELDQALVEDAASQLLDALIKAPPSRGS